MLIWGLIAHLITPRGKLPAIATKCRLTMRPAIVTKRQATIMAAVLAGGIPALLLLRGTPAEFMLLVAALARVFQKL